MDGDEEFTKTVLYGICIPLIVLICLLAVILNLAVFSSRLYVKSRSSSLELTYSLALSDTWTSIVISFSLFWNSYRVVIMKIPYDSHCFPLTMEMFRTGGMLTGVFHLAALAGVHYLQIVRPFDHSRLLSLRQVHLIIIVIWLLPPVALMIYAASWKKQGYRADKCDNMDFYESVYFRGQISMIIMVLMLTTCVIYWRLLRVVDKVRAKTVGATPSTPALAEKANGHNSNNSRGRRTVITATLIFGTFIFGWLPASVLYILTANGMPLYRHRSLLLNVVSVVVLLNIMIKTLTNPIIYATRIPEIRHFVMNKLLYRVTRKKYEAEKSEAASMRRAEFRSEARTNTLTACQTYLQESRSGSFIEKASPRRNS